MKKADIDGNGEISYSEWLAASGDMKKLITDEKLNTAFKFFDKDDNGQISVEELKEVLGVKKKLVEEKVWNEMISEADQNGDGQISLQEFKNMMSKLVESRLAPQMSKQAKGK